MSDVQDRPVNWWFEFKALREDVELLRRANHEMNEDEVLFAHMVQGSTGIEDLIQKALRQYRYRKELIRELERQNDGWKRKVELCRSIGHITEKQQFPEGTISEAAAPRPILYDETTIPTDYWTVDEAALGEALKSGLKVGDARLINSNEPPRTTIRIK